MARIVFLLTVSLYLTPEIAFAQIGDQCTNPYMVTLQDPSLAPCGFAEITGLDFTDFNDDTFSPSPSCSYGSNNNDIWVKLTVPPNADGFKITMDSSVITSADNDYQNFKVAVYTGNSCGSLSYKTCKSSSRARVYNNYFDGLAPGDQVYARIYTDNSPSGTWDRPFFARFTAISTGQSNDACANASALIPGNYCNYLATDKGESDDKAPDKLMNETSVCDPGNAEFGSFDNNQWYYFDVTATTTQPVQISISNVNCSVGDKILQVAIWKANAMNCSSWGAGYDLDAPSSASDGDLLACSVGTGSITLSENLPVGRYWYTVDGSAGSFCEYSITVAPVVTVPLRLIRFSAKETAETTMLSWSCSNVSGGTYFVVEYSEDGISFSEVEIIGSRPAFSEIESFETVVRKKGYYRIRMVEPSVHPYYSSIIKIENISGESITAYNESSRMIQLVYSGEKNRTAEIKMFHANGTEVMHLQKELKPGKNTLLIAQPAAGIYFLQFVLQEHFFSQKILIGD